MNVHRKKKPVEFHFVDMNDPERYKKLKVARACDFCRRRKSKCDIGIPGSGTCSNCQKHQMVCIFSPVSTGRINEMPTAATANNAIIPQQGRLLHGFPLLLIQDAQVGYEREPFYQKQQVSVGMSIHEPSLSFESQLFKIYFDFIHPALPLLLKQSIMNIHSQDRLLLSKGLRYAIMAIACHFMPPSSATSMSSTLGSFHAFDDLHMNTAIYFYETAKKEVEHAQNTLPPRLDTVQTLLLLYKHKEMMNQSHLGIHYLEVAQDMLGRLQAIIPQQQEMITRARWILFSCIGLGNLSDQHLSRLYNQFQLPDELPHPLAEETAEKDASAISAAHQRVNQFAQIANLSLLYSHTVHCLATGSTSQLICLKQFREIRQHWHDSLHPITQNRLVSLCTFDQEEIDILILYSAILYDMLYLLLIQYYHLPETEWDIVETAYRLQRMIHTWVTQTSFKSAIQSRRMASFGLMLCLDIHLSREEELIDFEIVEQIRQIIAHTQVDPRIDQELIELYIQLIDKKSMIMSSNSSHSNHNPSSSSDMIQQQPMDYFSLIPQHVMHSAASSPLDHPPSSTPGLWDMLSTTTNGGLSTPIREEDNLMLGQTTEWIIEQQRQQNQQFQLYHSQQQLQPFSHTVANTALFAPNTITEHTIAITPYHPAVTTTTAPSTSVAATIPEDCLDDFYIGSWSSNSNTVEHFNQMKI